VYEASFQGSKARVELRQGEAQHFVPELYVIPRPGAAREVDAGLEKWVEAHPGVKLERSGAETHIAIPAAARVGHEAHFGQVTSRFFEYLKSPASLPAWEKSNMLVKYYITTSGT
jgi:hypothetical protein